MGEPLENAQHELIALAVLEGKTLKQIADAANYHTKWRESHVCNLIKRPEIQARIQELQERTADDRVMSVVQRKIRLSEIGRGNDRPIQAIHILNLMDRLYKIGIDVNIQQRAVNISVISEASEHATRLIIEGIKTSSEADDNNVTLLEEAKSETEPNKFTQIGEATEEAVNPR